MVSNSDFFTTMPPLITGNILVQLNQITGSEGIINKEDIPVVFRYANNLALTNKRLFRNVNHLEAFDIFLESLSKKYGWSKEHFAALWNTRGTREWLWRIINTNGDLQSYQIIQEAHCIASNVFKQSKDKGLSFHIHDLDKEPNLTMGKTARGVRLIICENSASVETPFGKVYVYSFDGQPHWLVVGTLIERFSALFDKCIELYLHAQIREVRELPVTDFDSAKSYRSAELIERIWEMLEKNRLGKNPIEKSIAQCEVASFQEPNTDIGMKSLSELPGWAVNHLIMLYMQPNRHLTMPCLYSASLIEVLHNLARRLSLFKVRNIRQCGVEIYAKELDGRTDLGIDEHKYVFQRVVAHVCKNWLNAKLKDYPRIHVRKSEEDWALLVKIENTLREEFVFMNIFANVLGISDSVVCIEERHLYMWIKKKNIEETLRILDITLEESNGK